MDEVNELEKKLGLEKIFLNHSTICFYLKIVLHSIEYIERSYSLLGETEKAAKTGRTIRSYADSLYQKDISTVLSLKLLYPTCGMPVLLIFVIK